MTHPATITPAMVAARAVPILALPPHKMVTDDMLRHYAAVDPMVIADGQDEVLQAGLSMTLADICGELLAQRAAQRKGLA